MFFELLDFNGPKLEDDEQIVRLPLYLEALAAKTITFMHIAVLFFLLVVSIVKRYTFFYPYKKKFEVSFGFSSISFHLELSLVT